MTHLYPSISEIFIRSLPVHTEAAFHSRISAFADHDVTGYVHTLPQIGGILITADLVPYLIPPEVITDNNLATGDKVTAAVAYSRQYDRHVVVGLGKIVRVRYDEIGLVRSKSTFDIDKHKTKFGDTVLMQGKKLKDILRFIPNDCFKIVLSLDKKIVSTEKLNYCTHLTYSNRDKITICLLAFFKAKELAMQKKNVVLVVDSLDKMFHVYNNCMADDGVIDPAHISLGAVTDFESIICSGGAIKDGGSLTVIGLHNAGTTPAHKYITDRLLQICDVII